MPRTPSQNDSALAQQSLAISRSWSCGLQQGWHARQPPRRAAHEASIRRHLARHHRVVDCWMAHTTCMEQEHKDEGEHCCSSLPFSRQVQPPLLPRFCVALRAAARAIVHRPVALPLLLVAAGRARLARRQGRHPSPAEVHPSSFLHPRGPHPDPSTCAFVRPRSLDRLESVHNRRNVDRRVRARWVSPRVLMLLLFSRHSVISVLSINYTRAPLHRLDHSSSHGSRCPPRLQLPTGHKHGKALTASTTGVSAPPPPFRGRTGTLQHSPPYTITTAWPHTPPCASLALGRLRGQHTRPQTLPRCARPALHR